MSELEYGILIPLPFELTSSVRVGIDDHSHVSKKLYIRGPLGQVRAFVADFERHIKQAVAEIEKVS